MCTFHCPIFGHVIDDSVIFQGPGSPCNAGFRYLFTPENVHLRQLLLAENPPGFPYSNPGTSGKQVALFHAGQKIPKCPGIGVSHFPRGALGAGQTLGVQPGQFKIGEGEIGNATLLGQPERCSHFSHGAVARCPRLFQSGTDVLGCDLQIPGNTAQTHLHGGHLHMSLLVAEFCFASGEMSKVCISRGIHKNLCGHGKGTLIVGDDNIVNVVAPQIDRYHIGVQKQVNTVLLHQNFKCQFEHLRIVIDNPVSQSSETGSGVLTHGAKHFQNLFAKAANNLVLFCFAGEKAAERSDAAVGSCPA